MSKASDALSKAISGYADCLPYVNAIFAISDELLEKVGRLWTREKSRRDACLVAMALGLRNGGANEKYPQGFESADAADIIREYIRAEATKDGNRSQVVIKCAEAFLGSLHIVVAESTAKDVLKKGIMSYFVGGEPDKGDAQN